MKRITFDLLISDEMSDAMCGAYISDNPELTDDKLISLFIRDKLSELGLSTKLCTTCNCVKMLSEFYTPSHVRCTECIEKSMKFQYGGNYTKAAQRTNGKCVLCGVEFEHMHHLIPRSCGGGDSIYNLVPLCFKCHMEAHRGNFDNKTHLNKETILKLQQIFPYSKKGLIDKFLEP